MSQASTGLSKRTGAQAPPLVVAPREAARLLALGPSSLYGLLRAGELESFRDGRSRKITMRSIKKYLARQLAAARADGWGPWPHNPRALARLTPADRKKVPRRAKKENAA
jgi:excisionase family DNA binding protein